MTVYIPQNDNPIQEQDRTQPHPTNEARAVVDLSGSGWSWGQGRRSGWMWKTIFEYLNSNLWQSEPVGLSMSWHGHWTAQQYAAGNVVTDGLWLMVANQPTQEKAAPVLEGSPAWVLDAAPPTWATVSPNTTLVMTGARFNLTNADHMVLGARFYIPVIGANIQYHIVIREELEPGLYRNLISQDILPATAPGWYVLPFQGAVFKEDTNYEVVLMASDDTSSATHQGRYNYNQGTASATPAQGAIYLRTSTSNFRIYDIDDDGQLLDAELDLVVPGTEFVFENGAVYTVTQILSGGPLWHEFEVSTQGTPSLIGVQDVSFTVPAAAATDYVTEAGYWTTNPAPNGTVQGMLSVDGDPFALSDAAFGVDLQIDEVTVSDQWDVMALSTDLTP